MWKHRRKIVRTLAVLVLSAALSRAERYGLHDTASRNTQVRACCGGLEEGYPLAETSALNRVALYAGEEGQVIRYNANRQTAVDLVELNEPLVLFTWGISIFLVATIFKRKFLNSIPSEYVSADLSSLDSQSVNPEPVIGARGEQWGPGDRGALQSTSRYFGEGSS